MTSNSSADNSTVTEWVDDTIPRSLRFADTYYSRADGLGETRHVFLDGNRLTGRFSGIADGSTFIIAETGFGTGLNFLAAFMLWQKTAPPEARLQFISFERYPLDHDTITRAISRWPELKAAADMMLDAWDPGSDTLRIELPSGVTLTVHMDDANIRLPKLGFAADAWFLDGFAPSRNPELWNAELIDEIFRHTLTGGTFATYTAAGWVRRNLAAAGFAVQRQPGFSGKREMMAGCRQQNDR